MATIDECRAALAQLAAHLAKDPRAAARTGLDRSLACRIRDLDVTFHGQLTNGEITHITDGDDPGAQIRLALNGDDLLALVAGELHFAAAWASGRISVKASFTDLLKLRTLL